jgi:prepilin-type N-terminal cleavage/methylation domain-containing protein
MQPTGRTRGLTIIEMLIAAAILSILLATLGAVFTSNLRVSSQQISAADADLTVRLSLLRLQEIISQAHYIYPAGQTLTLNTPQGPRTFTTGPDVLAVLIPQTGASSYCPGTANRYCGRLYSIEARTPYQAILGADSGATNFALIEWQAENISWPQNQIPALTIATWANATPNVMADSVVPSASGGSSLAAISNLNLAATGAVYDRNASPGFSSTGAADAATALITAVAPNLVVDYGRGRVERASYAFSYAIPRTQQPNP